jgi:hypothetical protein
MKYFLFSALLLTGVFNAKAQAVRLECVDSYSKARLSSLRLEALGQESRRLRPLIRAYECPAALDETSYIRWLMGEVATRLDGQPQAVVLQTLGQPDSRRYEIYADGEREVLVYWWGPQYDIAYRLGFRRDPSGAMRSICYSHSGSYD